MPPPAPAWHPFRGTPWRLTGGSRGLGIRRPTRRYDLTVTATSAYIQVGGPPQAPPTQLGRPAYGSLPLGLAELYSGHDTRKLRSPVMNPTRQRRADPSLILLALSPKQRKRAHKANPGLGSVPAYVVLCGQYGQLFGSASQCRSLYEWWRNQYLDALFASAFESKSFPVDDYRSTPDLDAVLARAAAGADSQSDLGYIGLVDPEPDVAERRVPEAEVPLTPEVSSQLTPRQARQRAKYQEREGRRLERLRGNTGRKRRSVKTWLLVAVVLVGGLIIIGSLGEDDNDTTVRSTTRPATTKPATTKPATTKPATTTTVAPTALGLAEECFSGWSGNHRGFVDEVKAVLNDPGSMEVHGTYFNSNDSPADGIRIRMDYSAANAFGGMVRGNALADMAPDCSITIVQYE